MLSFGVPVATARRGGRVKILPLAQLCPDKADTVSAFQWITTGNDIIVLHALQRGGRTGKRGLYHSAEGLSDAESGKANLLACL
jgi:hypothetical protein